MILHLQLVFTFLIGLSSEINGTGIIKYIKFFLGDDVVVARGNPAGDARSYEIKNGQLIYKMAHAGNVDIITHQSLHDLLLKYYPDGSDSVNTNYIMAVAESTAVISLEDALRNLQWGKVLASNNLTFMDDVLTVRIYDTITLKCSLSAWEAQANNSHEKLLQRLTDDAHLLVSDDNKFRDNWENVSTEFNEDEIIIIEKALHTQNYNACIEALKIPQDAEVDAVEDPVYITLDSQLGDHDIRWWDTHDRVIIYSDDTFTAIRLAITPKRKIEIKFRLSRQPAEQSDIEGLVVHHDYLDQLCILPSDEFCITVGEGDAIDDELFPLQPHEFEDDMKMQIFVAKIGSPESSDEETEPKRKRHKVEGWKNVNIWKVVQTGSPGVILNYK